VRGSARDDLIARASACGHEKGGWSASKERETSNLEEAMRDCSRVHAVAARRKGDGVNDNYELEVN